MLSTKYLKDYAEEKIAPAEVWRASLTLFKAAAIEGRSQNPAWAQLCQNRAWDGIVDGVCWLFLPPTPEKPVFHDRKYC